MYIFTPSSLFVFQLASRTLRHQITPVILLKFQIRNGNEMETKLLQTDPVNLVHLTKSLEEALNEMKTSQYRRVVRHL